MGNSMETTSPTLISPLRVAPTPSCPNSLVRPQSEVVTPSEIPSAEFVRPDDGAENACAGHKRKTSRNFRCSIKSFHHCPEGKRRAKFQFPCSGYPDSKGSLPPILTTFTAPVME